MKKAIEIWGIWDFKNGKIDRLRILVDGGWPEYVMDDCLENEHEWDEPCWWLPECGGTLAKQRTAMLEYYSDGFLDSERALIYLGSM